MPNKNNILRFLIIVLFLSSIAIATETTWRHSGFEISGYDINGSSTYNLTEIRKIEFGWNTSIPTVSETSRAVMYYDDNQKRIMQSVNGGAYQAIVDNTTVNAYTVNAANATGVLLNASAPLSSLNRSEIRAKTGAFTRDLTTASGNQAITGIGFKPTSGTFYSVINGVAQASWGMDDGITHKAMIDYSATTANTYAANDLYSMVFYFGANEYNGNISSWDADGFTVAWTKVNTPTGTAQINYIVYI